MSERATNLPHREDRPDPGRAGTAAVEFAAVLTFVLVPPMIGLDVTVAFAFTSGNTALTDPYQGVKGQKFNVTVTLNQAALDKCLWTALGLVKPSSVAYTASWQIMVDDPFSINSNLPTW